MKRVACIAALLCLALAFWKTALSQTQLVIMRVNPLRPESASGPMLTSSDPIVATYSSASHSDQKQDIANKVSQVKYSNYEASGTTIVTDSNSIEPDPLADPLSRAVRQAIDKAPEPPAKLSRSGASKASLDYTLSSHEMMTLPPPAPGCSSCGPSIPYVPYCAKQAPFAPTFYPCPYYPPCYSYSGKLHSCSPCLCPARCGSQPAAIEPTYSQPLEELPASNDTSDKQPATPKSSAKYPVRKTAFYDNGKTTSSNELELPQSLDPAPLPPEELRDTPPESTRNKAMPNDSANSSSTDCDTSNGGSCYNGSCDCTSSQCCCSDCCDCGCCYNNLIPGGTSKVFYGWDSYNFCPPSCTGCGPCASSCKSCGSNCACGSNCVTCTDSCDACSCCAGSCDSGSCSSGSCSSCGGSGGCSSCADYDHNSSDDHCGDSPWGWGCHWYPPGNPCGHNSGCCLFESFGYDPCRSRSCCPLHGSDDCCSDGCCDCDNGCWAKQHDITFGGWIDGGIMGNGRNTADNFNGPLTFPDRNAEGQVNQIWLSLDRSPSPDNCGWFIGGHVDYMFGSDFFFTTAAGLDGSADGNRPRWNTDPRSLYGFAMPQLYVETDYDDIRIKWGHFFTILGYEVVPAVGNFFYSHSYVMQYGEPFTHTGFLATKPSGNWTFSGGLVAGWNTFDANDRAAWIGGVTYADKEWGSLGFSIITGNDSTSNQPGVGPFASRTLYSLVWTHNFTDRFTYVLQHDLGEQNEAQTARGGGAQWYGINQYLFYKLNNCWNAGMRIEWFRDDDGFVVTGLRPGNAIDGASFPGNFYEVTGGLNYKPNAHLTVRPEVRWDWYNGQPNQNQTVQASSPYNAGTSNSQFTLGADLIYQW